MHQHQQWARVFILHHEGLDHRIRVLPQHVGAVLRTAVLKVRIHVLGKDHTVRAQPGSGWSFADVGFF